jgi:alanine racemase
MRPLQAIIDLSALKHNFLIAKRISPQQKLMAVVKANAYGHGLIECATAFEEVGADTLAVSSIEEALQLRENNIKKPIVLLEGFFEKSEIPFLVEHELQIVLHHPQQVAHLLENPPSKPIPVWLKFDSGMNRLGFNINELQTAYQTLFERPEIANPIRLMTHLACADEQEKSFTINQIQKFTQITQHWNHEKSLANSAGLLGWQQAHADWGRPGIMLYGSSPFLEQPASNFDLKPVMTLKSKLISVKNCQKGETVGYGATWECPENMQIGIIAAGYGDGYPRHAKSGTPVYLNGRRVPLIGRVSMDMLAVDLRSCKNPQIGDEVELWGQHISIDEVAQYTQTISYPLLCGVTMRVPRLFQN